MTDNWEQTRTEHRTRQAEAIAGSALSLIMEHGAPALTMAAIASAADISRQTLYRYYPDVDAVLLGIAKLITSHDEKFKDQMAEQPDPATQLDLIVRTIIGAGGHDGSAALRATLPPEARDVLSQHEARIELLLTNVLIAGVADGLFRSDLEPAADAPLILGLAAAANQSNPERAITLVQRIVNPQPRENQT